MARVGIMCSAAHSEWVGQFVGRTRRSAPSKRQDAGRLGKAAVVTDVHADLEAARVVDRERPVAGVDEHVDPQERQMDLAIGADHAVRTGQHAGVEQPRRRRAPAVRRCRSTDAARRPRSPRRTGALSSETACASPSSRDWRSRSPRGHTPGRRPACARPPPPRSSRSRICSRFAVEPAQLRLHLDGGHAVGRRTRGSIVVTPLTVADPASVTRLAGLGILTGSAELDRHRLRSRCSARAPPRRSRGPGRTS